MSTPSEYDKGTRDGAIDARLAGHDRHFASINGSLTTIATEVHGLRLAVQRLADEAVARDRTVVTTAAALKDAKDAEDSTSVRRWTPMQRGLAVVAGLVGLVLLVLDIVARLGG